MVFPTDLEDFQNAASTETLAAAGGSGLTSMVNQLNDVTEALQAKVGIDSSAVTTSHDYKLSGITSSDIAVSLTGTETLTNKTLTSPKVTAYDGIYNGTSKVVELGSWGTPANYILLETGEAGGDPVIASAGSDTNIDLALTAKGSGVVKADGYQVGRVVASAVVSQEDVDGTADDVQIQAAIDAVEAAGGGTVLIRAGTYVLDTGLTIDSSNLTIMGEGIGATILQAKASIADNTDLIYCTADRTNFMNFTIDGNKDNNTTAQSGLHCYDADYQKIFQVEVKNMSRDAGTEAGIWTEDCYYCTINDCVARGCEYYGFKLGYASSVSNCISNDNFVGYDIAAQNCVNNCVSINDDIYGISISSTDNRISACRIKNCGDDGIYMSGARNIIVGCEISSEDDCIYVAGDNNVIANNIIDSVDCDADNTHDGIYLNGGATRNIVSGNRILQSSGSNNFKYGIVEDDATADYNIITSNIVDDGQTGKISTAGANTVSANNITT